MHERSEDLEELEQRIRGMNAIVVGIGGVIMAFDAGKKFPDDYSI